MNDSPPRATGGCLCGAVLYEVHGPLRPVVLCHCTACRRQSGHYAAVTATRRSDFRLVKNEGLSWYQSDPDYRRGFCRHCGSNLFWEPVSGESAARYISIMAGTLDLPTNLSIAQHVFVAAAGDYYTIDDDLPQYLGDGPQIPIPAR